MKFHEDSDQIVVSHAPVGKWVLGGIFTSVFVAFCLWFCYLALTKSPTIFEASRKDWLEILPFTALSATLVLIAVFEISFVSLIFAPLTSVGINRKTGCVEVTRRRLYGSRSERFYFYQIQKFKSYKPGLIFSSKYLLALVLANRKIVKLNIPVGGGGDKKKTVKLIKKLNKFIKNAEVR